MSVPVLVLVVVAGGAAASDGTGRAHKSHWISGCPFSCPSCRHNSRFVSGTL